MNTPRLLVIDIGGNHVKLMISPDERRKIDSGRDLTPQAMIEATVHAVRDWTFEAIAVGFPGRVRREQIIEEPVNLGSGWVGFDFSPVFGAPVRVMNDAALQALGSYDGGRMLFLGFGTALGSTLITGGAVIPLELGTMPFDGNRTLAEALGRAALDDNGPRRWGRDLHRAIEFIRSAFQPDEIVLGGGNVDQLDTLPAGCRRGDNRLVYEGGIRLWNAVVPPEGTVPAMFRVA